MAEMKTELTFIEIIKILKKRIYFFLTVFITGIILISLFFTFRFPPESVSTRIYSEDFRDIFKMISNEKGFLFPAEFKRLIQPVIELIDQEGKLYKIQIKDTLLKENINTIILRINDLIISRKFPKGEKQVREKFFEDLKDFFKKFEEQVFLLFLYNTRIEKINLENQIFLKKKLLEELGKSISITKQYLNVSVSNFKDILERNAFYLPPEQQYYGLVIERDNLKNKLVLLDQQYKETKGLLEIIDKRDIHLFKSLSVMEKLKNFEKLYVRITSISKKWNILINNYFKGAITEDESISAGYLLFCSLFFYLIFSFMIVLIVEWYFRNKKMITGKQT
ncbi:MAG: hypothetical protein KAR14_10330 [Candidatus Aminicenantes bacterium]|nr:hypothetical protein [Candidatus Aminicenantes bacterium]